MTSHIPATFFRKRVVPSTPPSLVNPASSAAGEPTGESSSSPISDQVPEEMYARGWVSCSAGTASTAEAVSWEPTAITGTSPIPSSAASWGSTVPRRSPGESSGASSAGSTPAASSSSGDQSCVSSASIPVLEALVRSVRRCPVSR